MRHLLVIIIFGMISISPTFGADMDGCNAQDVNQAQDFYNKQSELAGNGLISKNEFHLAQMTLLDVKYCANMMAFESYCTHQETLLQSLVVHNSEYFDRLTHIRSACK